MKWVRNFLVYLLSVVLLVSLIGLAFATSADINLTHASQIESWLNQSNIYSSFATNAAQQAKKSIGYVDPSSGDVTSSDLAIETAAQTAFSPSLLQQSVDSFINSNYSWLEGKTNTPDFRIDLTSAKQDFAAMVGHYAETYIAGLPVCTTAQATQMQKTNILHITCRPSNVALQTVQNAVTSNIANSTDFLSNPVITASNFDPGFNSHTKPYYEKVPHAPKLYRLGLKLPFVLVGVIVVSGLGIVFISPRRRKGIRKIGLALFLSGIVLVATRLLANTALTKIDHRLLNSSAGGIQQSLVSLAKLVEEALVKTDLYFAITYIVLSVLVLVALLSTRRPKKSQHEEATDPETMPEEPDDLDLIRPLPREETVNQVKVDYSPPVNPKPTPSTAPTIPTPQAQPKPAMDIMSPRRKPAQIGSAIASTGAKQPPRPRRPRLIQ